MRYYHFDITASNADGSHAEASRLVASTENEFQQRIYASAQAMLAAGRSFLPVENTGKKKPLAWLLPNGQWEALNGRHPTPEETVDWFSPDGRGQAKCVGLVCGAISGFMVVMDFDEPEVFKRFREENEELLTRLKIPLEYSPSGGGHGFFLCPELNNGNCRLPRTKKATKLSQDKLSLFPGSSPLAKTDKSPEHPTGEVLIEIRAQGSYCIVAPSVSSKGEYQRISGDPSQAPTLSLDDWYALLEAAKKYNQNPDLWAEPVTRKAAQAKPKPAGKWMPQPIEFFNETVDFDSLLAELGYTPAGGNRWIRPGGESASVEVMPDKKTRHFSSDDPLCDGAVSADCGIHSPFDLFCFHKCNGDVKEAVRQVVEKYASAILRVPEGGTDQIILSAKEPDKSAAIYLELYCNTADNRGLQYWRNSFYYFDDRCYLPIQEGFVKEQIRQFMAQAVTWTKGPGGLILAPFSPTPKAVNDVLELLKMRCALDDTLIPPFYINDRGDRPDPRELIIFRNCVVHVPLDDKKYKGSYGKVFDKPTVDLFAIAYNDYDFLENPGLPRRFVEAYSDTHWKDDAESFETFLAFLGVLMTRDTSRQKFLAGIGLPAGGKGTACWLIERLVGMHNVVTPTLDDMGSKFEATCLMGKSVALFPEAMLGGKSDKDGALRTILSISGQDSQNMKQKHKEAIKVELDTRFALFSTETPAFAECSRSLIRRLLMIRFTASLEGKEDRNLRTSLLAELPAIAIMALEARKRMIEAGGELKTPASCAEEIAQFMELSNPWQAFVDECCDVHPQLESEVQDVFNSWMLFCEETNRKVEGTREVFSKKLLTAMRGKVTTGRARPVPGGKQVRMYFGLALKQECQASVRAHKLAANQRRIGPHGFAPSRA
jgi:Bifunctional DNA primase/polymerase, N-terminal